MNPINRLFFAAEADAPGPRRALILAGGGMRVSYQAGVLRALAEAGLHFVHGDGTSGGTMNLAMLFSGLSPVEMCDRWRTLEVKNFISLMPIKDYLKAFDMMAMGDADGIVDSVFPHLGIDVAKINSAEGMLGTFNVCNYTDKTNEVIPHDKVDLDFLIAGISLPVFMPPVQKGDVLYTDSVWIKDANLMEAVRRGADELWVVWCIGNMNTYNTGFFNQYVHMIELSANGALHEEFVQINEINARIEKGEAVYGHTTPIKLHLIKPEYPLPLDPDLYLGHIDNASLIDMGYADAKTYLNRRTQAGTPFQPASTKMRTPKTGITFRETMGGTFSMDEIDPKSGAKKGKAAGTTLSMHVTIHIEDLYDFLGNPYHAGRITGRVDYPPFGSNIPAKRGVFNLFHPSDDPALLLMIYELAFEAEGQAYYLAGRKEVRDDPGFDLWQDTTTLLTRLHRGEDDSAPVVGAGVLSLSVSALKKMLSTIHVTHATSTKEKTKALYDFGQFFMGSLWDTYLK